MTRPWTGAEGSPTAAQAAEARETIRTCEAAGLLAGPIYLQACEVIAADREAWRAALRNTISRERRAAIKARLAVKLAEAAAQARRVAA